MNCNYRDILNKYNQNELLSFIDNVLNDEEKNEIINQFDEIDFEKMKSLFENAANMPEVDKSKIDHIKCVSLNDLSEEQFNLYKSTGEEVIKAGKYAVVTMAGGQGTRLGHNGPKGTFKINTDKGEKYLFQIIVEGLQKANNKYNVTIPWYIMTSEDNNVQTKEFLESNNYFGYPKSSVKLFRQGNLPMIRTNGSLIVDKDKKIKLASDGNGSVYKSLKRANIIEEMKQNGIEWIFVGGVDNILLRVVDPILTGISILQNNVVSSKSVVKKNAKERAGVFCKLNGKPKVIEYTELPEEMAEAIDENGNLIFGEVNILSHLFNIRALEQIANIELPYHTALKKSSYFDKDGNWIEVSEPNAYKFESFIFDGFSIFDDMGILRVNREDEFAPIKNATGSDSPETAVNLYNDFFRRHNK